MKLPDRAEKICVDELHTADIRALLDSGGLRDWTDSALPFPTVADLLLYAENSEQAIACLLCSAEGRRVALFPFEIEQRSIHRVQAKSLSNVARALLTDSLSNSSAERISIEEAGFKTVAHRRLRDLSVLG